MAACPRCGRPQPDNSRYCTACGYEEKDIHGIWETPSYRDWDDPRVDDFWDRPFITLDLHFRTSVVSKGQFLLGLVAMSVWLTVSVLFLAFLGFVVEGVLFGALFSPLFVWMYLLYKRGEEDLRWARVMGTRIGQSAPGVEAPERPERLMRRRRI